MPFLAKIYKEKNAITLMETVTIPKKEYEILKKQAKIDVDLLQQFMGSLADIKAGRVRRVK